MPYVKSEERFNVGLKPVEDWNAPDNKTQIEAKDRYKNILSKNLLLKPYQVAKGNNIKRLLDLRGKLLKESPKAYINRNVKAFENDELKITDILVASNRTALSPDAKPQKVYLLGQNNFVKAGFFSGLIRNIGKPKALEIILIADLSLIVGFSNVDNSDMENFILDVADKKDWVLNGTINLWTKSFIVPELKTQDNDSKIKSEPVSYPGKYISKYARPKTNNAGLTNDGTNKESLGVSTKIVADSQLQIASKKVPTTVQKTPRGTIF